MKKASVLMLLFLSLLVGCESPTAHKVPPCPGFPPDPEIILPDIFPTGHIVIAASYDGRYVAYRSLTREEIGIVDVVTYRNFSFDLQPLLPSEYELISEATISWCPYDSERCLIIAIGSKQGEMETFSFLVELSHGKIYRCPADISPYRSQALIRWLANSRPGEDYFWISEEQMYWLQKDTVLKLPERYKDLTAVWSAEGKRVFRIYELPGYQQAYYIDSVELHFDPQPPMIEQASWSPSGERLALGVKIPGNPALHRVWILDSVGTILSNRPAVIKPAYVISFAGKCLFSLDYCPVFISDTTLAISLIPSGTLTSLVYEITLTGEILRQLTFSL